MWNFTGHVNKFGINHNAMEVIESFKQNNEIIQFGFFKNITLKDVWKISLNEERVDVNSQSTENQMSS